MAQVTVVVPSLNQGRFLETALQSVVNQAIEVEIFLMDGGSNDGPTAAVIERWAPRLAGYRSGPDGGQAQAINEGMRLGCAEYVCWLNSDDWLMPGGLGRLLTELCANPDVPATYGKAWDFYEGSNRKVPVRVEPFDERRLALRCIVSQPATLIRRSVWEALGGLDESLNMAMDFDLWWRIFRRFDAMQFVDVDVAVNRVHANTKTNMYRRQHYEEAMRVVKTHYGSIPLKWWLYQPYAVWWKSLVNPGGR